MRARFGDRGAGERGFILVGVVTFMLALTILGLSLFALSSFEAQFFTAAVAREQSLQSAESGMELAKVLLSQSPAPQRLESVQQAVGQFGVTSALAYQTRTAQSLPADTISQGPIDWDREVNLVVSARSGGVERQLVAQFRPGDNPYRRLLTAGDGMRVDTDPRSVLELRGRVWQHVESASDTAWTNYVTWSEGRPVQTNRPPRPQADAFVDAHLADPGTTGPSQVRFDEDETRLQMWFRNTGEGARFFRSPPSPSDASGFPDYTEYTFFAHKKLTIWIQGTVVWVAPEGVSFQTDVKVLSEDGLPATLVIVAKRNGKDRNHEDRGISFKGGLAVSDPAHVYLVSEGDIGLTHQNNVYDDQEALHLSVVAGGRIELEGPEVGNRFKLVYDATEMDPIADQLLAAGALPPLAMGASTTFQLVRATWLETTPR